METTFDIYSKESEVASDLPERISYLDFEINQKKYLVELFLKEISSMKKKYESNLCAIKSEKKLPYVCTDVREVLDLEDDEGKLKKFCVIEKPDKKHCLAPCGETVSSNISPGIQVGAKIDSYAILEQLPKSFDASIQTNKNFENFEHFSDIGGQNKAIKELQEIISHTFFKRSILGISLPKGVLLYGPPGNGKTLLARACAAEINTTFISVSGPGFLRKYIGEGAKFVRDVFDAAKKAVPAVIFIDEIDAIGKKRSESSSPGDGEVERTLLELLGQLDGIWNEGNIIVLAATSRLDVLDPALLRSGRLAKKIEIQQPDEEGRLQILKIHSRKLVLSPEVCLRTLSRQTEGLSGAECKAVCLEAGMIALRQSNSVVQQEDFFTAVEVLQGRSKTTYGTLI